jgi:hypothetical protein
MENPLAVLQKRNGAERGWAEAQRLHYHRRIMPYAADLAEAGAVKRVGYLWFGHPYTKGKVEEVVLERLVEMAAKPFFFAGGYHECNVGLCRVRLLSRGQLKFRYGGQELFLGSTEILVPGDDVVYCAPNLILHYIRDHGYRPPECFREAVVKCPAIDSAEYRERIKRIAPEWARLIGWVGPVRFE